MVLDGKLSRKEAVGLEDWGAVWRKGRERVEVLDFDFNEWGQRR